MSDLTPVIVALIIAWFMRLYEVLSSMFRSLKFQIYAIAFAPFLFIALIASSIHTQVLSGLGQDISDAVGNSILEIEKNRLVTVVSSAKSIIQPYIDMPGKEGMPKALEVLSQYEFDGGAGYLYGADADGTRLLFGKSGRGIGQNHINLQDKKGNYLIREMIKIGKSGGGFYTYYFPRPGEKETSPKYSYTIYIEKWNFILGTGFYVDSLEPTLNKIDSNIQETKSKGQVSSVMITGLVALVIGLIVVFITRRIYSSLAHLSASVDDLAKGEGDLTQSIDRSSIQLLDDIAQNFNLFLRSMASDMRSLRKTGTSLIDMATKATERQIELAHTSDQQKQQTVTIAASIDEMSSTSSEVASHAEETRVSAESATLEVGAVLRQVQTSSDHLNELNTLLEGVKRSIDELADNVDSINSVLDVIQGIAEQTNMLALNAAIEAARAGEQGRGFAVVADEVRSLSKRSKQSTIEIADILARLRSSTEKTKHDMAASTMKRAAALEAMGKIRQLIGSTSSTIQNLANMNILVATAATEQSAVIDDVAHTINKITSLAEEVGRGSHESQRQFETLEHLAKDINTVSNKFKL